MHSQLTQIMPPCKKHTALNKMHFTHAIIMLASMTHEARFTLHRSYHEDLTDKLASEGTDRILYREAGDLMLTATTTVFTGYVKKTCTFHIQQHWNNQNRVAKIASHTHARTSAGFLYHDGIYLLFTIFRHQNAWARCTITLL
jgi:hypothetical protein